MKSEHRHELKSNELADWLGNLPQWSKENLNSILIIIAVIVVIAGFFAWRYYAKDIVQYGEREKFTNMLDNMLGAKTEIVQQLNSGNSSDISYILLKESTDIDKFAASAGNKDMAALAYIKGADAIRSELHYRPATISKQELTDQIEKAKNGYLKALAKSPTNKTIKGLAKFNLGMCSEELGDFNDARKTYSDIAADADFEGTVLVNKANLRLRTMDDYKQSISFKPAPPRSAPDANAVLDPIIKQIRNSQKSVDTNLPAKNNAADANLHSVNNKPSSPVETSLPAGIKSPNDINKP